MTAKVARAISGATRAGAARRRARQDGVFEARTMAVKELTQISNRRRFHGEKAAFAAVTVAIFLAASYDATDGWRMDIQAMSQFGRQTFVPVSLGACLILSLVTLVSSTGIITSELTGKRLDVLRITALSLNAIVLGKGAALMARSLLVLALLLPLLAATQLFGGVSAGDVVRAFLLILVDVFFFACVGLYVSAGARTMLDRVLRSAEVLFLWLTATGVAAGFVTMLGSTVAGKSWTGGKAMSPIWVWEPYLSAQLSWAGLGLNLVFHAVGGLLFLRFAIRNLEKAVATAEIIPEEPKVKDLLRGIKRIKLPFKLFKARARQREWAGTLVGSQLTQTSLAAVLLPLAVGMPQVMMFVLLVVSGRADWSMTRDYPSFIGATLGGTMLIMLALQSASIMAREKSRHTAEVLAATPSGDAGMIWWKGAAVGISQTVSLALCVVLFPLAAYSNSGSPAPAAAAMLGIATLVIFTFALGAAFSQVSKSPFEAVGLMAGSAVVLAPALVSLVRREPEYGDFLVWWLDPRDIMAVGFLAVGLAGVVLRNVFVRWAKVALAGGVAMSMAAGSYFMPVTRGDGSGALLPLAPLLGVMEVRSGVALRQSVWVAVGELALSAALVAGCYVNFSSAFLYGAKPKD